ncbi:hypothetical protein C2E23DRAFT_550912 [Lenzites betulinus]|nr:hypothetical protein C2E23DRAFT_550912 [Lenzites betulinus]
MFMLAIESMMRACAIACPRVATKRRGAPSASRTEEDMKMKQGRRSRCPRRCAHTRLHRHQYCHDHRLELNALGQPGFRQPRAQSQSHVYDIHHRTAGCRCHPSSQARARANGANQRRVDNWPAGRPRCRG